MSIYIPSFSWLERAGEWRLAQMKFDIWRESFRKGHVHWHILYGHATHSCGIGKTKWQAIKYYLKHGWVD